MAWIKRLTWPGLRNWTNSKKDVFDGRIGGVKVFLKKYQNFAFYNVLKSGHEIPMDQPEIAFKIMRQIIGS